MVSISQMYFANSLLSGNFTPRSSHICLLQEMCEERGVKNWCGMVKEILHKCGFDSLWQRNKVDGLSAKEFKSMVECCLYRLESIKWLQKVEEKEKLVLYKHKIGFC